MEGKVRLTQCEKVIRHLRDHGSISTMEAMYEYGIARLSSRIYDLKRKGYTLRMRESPSKIDTAKKQILKFIDL